MASLLLDVASPVGLSGEFERSNTNEVSGATILLGFNALQFTATYPGDSKRHEAVKIDMWKKPAPTNSRVNYSASQAGPRLCAQDSGAALSEASGMDFSQTGASWGRSGCMLTDDLSGITDMVSSAVVHTNARQRSAARCCHVTQEA